MFTPLQHQEGFSPFASFRNFNITVNDACERFFLGSRASNEGYQEHLVLTSVRIALIFTLIVPLLVAITFLITTALIALDKDKQEYWENKIQTYNIENDLFVEGLCRSGIQATSFEHICVTVGEPHFFHFDGAFFHLTTDKNGKRRHRDMSLPIVDPFKSLKVCQLQSVFTSFDSEDLCLDNGRDTGKGIFINKVDLFLLKYFGKISNRLKETVLQGISTPRD